MRRRSAMTDEYPSRCRDKIFIRDGTRRSRNIILASVRTFVLLNGHRCIMSILCFLTYLWHDVIDASNAFWHRRAIYQPSKRDQLRKLASFCKYSLEGCEIYPKPRTDWRADSSRRSIIRSVESNIVTLIFWQRRPPNGYFVILISPRFLQRLSYSLACRFHRGIRDLRKNRPLIVAYACKLSYLYVNPRYEISLSKYMGNNFKTWKRTTIKESDIKYRRRKLKITLRFEIKIYYKKILKHSQKKKR